MDILPMRNWLFAVLTVLSLVPEAALAHRRGAPPPDSGIGISSLTHGQMAVISRHRAKILSLASRHYPPDDRLRRLTNHAALQHAWCLWGIMPGTLADEASPFNICAHAYLAATRDALLRLGTLRPDDRAVQSLTHRIEAEMMSQGAALVLCQYSADAFSTAEIVRPDWHMLPAHWPTIATFLAIVTAVSGAGFALCRPRQNHR